MGLRDMFGPLVSDGHRKRALLAVTSGYMLIQLSSMPVALSLPTLAKQFDASLTNTALIVVVYLATLGSFVMLGARLGDRYGHARVFFIGILVSTVGALFIAMSSSLMQIIVWRALTGLGAALVMGNANAILAGIFPADERGRAFAVPIMGARFGTLIGIVSFGFFLTFLSWRLVFITFLPMGLIAIALSIPMLREKQEPSLDAKKPLDVLGGILLVVTLAVLILSSNHLHGGEESFTSSEGLGFHLPMHLLFLGLLAVFIFVERSVQNPVVEIGHFKQKYFSMSLVSNVTFHFSMLATTVLIPILVERGFGLAPLWVTVVLLPNQLLGLGVPMIAGWVYDRYNPKLLRPGAMVMISAGFLIVGIFAGKVPFWVVPIMLIPIFMGSSIFNPINNAAVMNSLPTDFRGFSSGMLETTREMGHAMGATASAAVLAIVLPIGISALSDEASQSFYIEGFQMSAMMVVLVMLVGAAISYFHKTRQQLDQEEAEKLAAQTAYSAGDD